MLESFVEWLASHIFAVIGVLFLFLILVAEFRTRRSDQQRRHHDLSEDTKDTDFSYLRGKEGKNTMHVRRYSMKDESYKNRK